MKGLALAIICVLPNLIYSLGFPQTKNLIPAYQAISTPDFGYLPTYVARAKGFFTDERLDLKVIVVNSRVSVPALIANEVHFGVAGPSITASLRGAPLKAIYFIYNTSTFQFTVRPEIRTPDNLKGKTVAISSPGATNDLATRLILAKLGLDPVRDVKFIAIGDAKARVIAMDQGQVAAAANNPDIAAELVRKGYRILMHSGEVFPVPFSGTAVNQKLIRENPDLIKCWLRAHLKAMLLIRQRPEEAAQIAAKDLKINPEVAREATSQVLQFMYPDDPGGFTENGMRVYLQQTAPRLGVDPDKVAISQIADMSFLREVQREMGIHCRGGYGC
ncbi:MAG TPA: ABC transporter substrate-binding protein [Candidatus Binatia bacterium]|nr:ABC transporter substrate-binding protein [Candidatus Binatia bacterium]